MLCMLSQATTCLSQLWLFQHAKMNKKSWVSRMIINCPGINRCEYYKPGETNHPQQHEVCKVVYENETSSNANRANKPKAKTTGTFLNNLVPVPFDPKVDPPVPGACFNCWRTNHFLRDCYLEKRYIFCRNCGRRHVEVENCPRCSKAYLEYIEEFEHIQAKIEVYGDESNDYYEERKKASQEPKKNESHFQGSSVESRKEFGSGGSFDKDWRSGSATNKKPAGLVSSNDHAPSAAKSLNEYRKEHEKVVTSIVDDFKSMNLTVRSKDERETLSASCNMNSAVKKKDEQESCHVDVGKSEENCGKSTEKNVITSPTSMIETDSTDCKSLQTPYNEEVLEASSLSSKMDEDDEDYDDMIVDEDEKSVASWDTGDTLQKFLELMDSVKKLPIEAQNVAVRCFVNSQKKQNQK